MEIANVPITEAIAVIDRIAAEIEQHGETYVDSLDLKFIYKALAALSTCKELGGR